MSGWTPGPWRWFGDKFGIYLATPDRGRRWVMGFRRMGLQGAQPTFSVGSEMVDAGELVEFEVGCPEARGFDGAKRDHSVYRTDIAGIDHPDARLIAAAPDLAEAAEIAARLFDNIRGAIETGQIVDKDAHSLAVQGRTVCRAVLAKAKGEKP